MRLEYFQMLDRFVDVKADERWIKTQSTVPMQSPVFEGHFPGYPLMPGVLLIENMAQTCGWLVSAITGFNRATGELQVEEGKYTAYGRRLDVEHGRLLYSNGPLNDPAIDLRAIKKFPDITAGVNVRGTLRQPRMTFFSDPPVAQAQIVSLLLAGGSLESVQNTSDTGQRNLAARNNMLLQGSALLFQQFGGKVGLDDVSVESDLNNDTSLVLGRYLSPRLYVSYGISVVEAINTIKMRYTIGDHWTIKSEAGTERSADLVYTIER